jgi:hypothetical protein
LAKLFGGKELLFCSIYIIIIINPESIWHIFTATHTCVGET